MKRGGELRVFDGKSGFAVVPAPLHGALDGHTDTFSYTEIVEKRRFLGDCESEKWEREWKGEMNSGPFAGAVILPAQKRMSWRGEPWKKGFCKCNAVTSWRVHSQC